jgi:hypothetical protein
MHRSMRARAPQGQQAGPLVSSSTHKGVRMRARRRGVHGGEEGYMHEWPGELDRSIFSLASAGGACWRPAGEQAGKECTCPASPPRAPRHVHPPLDRSIDDRSIRRSHLRSRGWIYPSMAVTTPAMYTSSLQLAAGLSFRRCQIM